MAGSDAPALFQFLTRMGDTTLVLGHRVSEWCGRGPVLEEDIALANTALDLIGQTQLWLALAGEVEGVGRTADDLAYLRDSREFHNLLLVEQPNGDFGQTLMRQFLFDAWHFGLLGELERSSESRVAEIAEKARKEAAYHLERSGDLVVRLGDGTDESNRRLQTAVDLLWPYTGEMFLDDEIDQALADRGTAPKPSSLRDRWDEHVARAFTAGMLEHPEDGHIQKGGRQGVHTEHLGYLLAEMQVLQRNHPGAVW